MKNKGQVAIVVLLVSAVMLSLGLSMSKGEITQIKINSNDELLKKAFDVSESGINYYLGTGNKNYTSPSGDSSAIITTANISDGSNKIDFGDYVPSGSSENYWLVNHLVNGDIGATYFSGPNMDVCGVGFSGSIKIDYFYKSGVSYGLKRIGYNFNTNPTYQVAGFTYSSNNCVRVSVIGSPVLLSVTPIFNGGKFYVQAMNGGSFSSQGIDVISEGSANGINKKLNIRQRYRLPGFMSSGMVAEGSILSD